MLNFKTFPFSRSSERCRHYRGSNVSRETLRMIGMTYECGFSGFCSLLLIFSNISKVLIVVIIRAVEMWKTYVIACQPLEFFLNRSCRPSALPQHQLSLLLSFHRVAPLFGNLSVMFQSSFRRTRVRYISLMSPRSASSSSRSSRFSFIFSSTLVTEYITVEWSRLNFLPMSLNGRSSIWRHRYMAIWRA